jgi:putative transposase
VRSRREGRPKLPLSLEAGFLRQSGIHSRQASLPGHKAAASRPHYKKSSIFGRKEFLKITMASPIIAWPHAPTHRLCDAGTFMVTAGTYKKAHHFRSKERLDVLQRGLLKLATQWGWQIEAWAVFSNHYHFVAHSPRNTDSAESLGLMIKELHAKTAVWVNRLDGASGRKIWHNYYESKLTFEKSYFARLKYTHHNAVHHGLVRVANQYPWCSASWFEQTASPSQIKTIYQFPSDRVSVLDDYQVGSL